MIPAQNDGRDDHGGNADPKQQPGMDEANAPAPWVAPTVDVPEQLAPWETPAGSGGDGTDEGPAESRNSQSDQLESARTESGGTASGQAATVVTDGRRHRSHRVRMPRWALILLCLVLVLSIGFSMFVTAQLWQVEDDYSRLEKRSEAA